MSKNARDELYEAVHRVTVGLSWKHIVADQRRAGPDWEQVANTVRYMGYKGSDSQVQYRLKLLVEDGKVYKGGELHGSIRYFCPVLAQGLKDYKATTETRVAVAQQELERVADQLGSIFPELVRESVRHDRMASFPETPHLLVDVSVRYENWLMVLNLAAIGHRTVLERAEAQAVDEDAL